MWKLLRNVWINFGWDFTYTHKSVTGQQNINIQIKYQVIVSQVPVVMSQVAHRKCWRRGFARGTWSSGKWQVVPSRKFTYPKLSQMFQKNQETSSFWLLGNAKNPTDLKPHWSRAGLRHPDIWMDNGARRYSSTTHTQLAILDIYRLEMLWWNNLCNCISSIIQSLVTLTISQHSASRHRQIHLQEAFVSCLHTLYVVMNQIRMEL